MKPLLALFLLLLTTVNSFYSSESPVIHLTDDNFDDIVSLSDDMVFVQFYSSYVTECEQIVPEFEKTATVLKGIVKVAAIEVNYNKVNR